MSLLLLILPALFGTLIVRPFFPLRGKTALASAGLVIGISFLTALAVLFALAGLTFTHATIAALAVEGGIAAGIFHGVAYRVERLEPAMTQNTGARLLSGLLILTVALLLCFTVHETLKIRPEGYQVGFDALKTSLPLHLHYISAFRYLPHILPTDPLLAGSTIGASFFADFFSAMSWRFSGDLVGSLQWPALALGLAAFCLLIEVITTLTASQSLAVWGAAVFFLGGSTSAAWPNIMSGIFLAQRGLQFALPLLLLMAVLLIAAGKKPDRRIFMMSAVAFALLPFFDLNSALAAIIIALLIFLRAPSKNWWWFVIPAGVVGIPQILYLTGALPVAKTFPISWPRPMEKDLSGMWHAAIVFVHLIGVIAAAACFVKLARFYKGKMQAVVALLVLLFIAPGLYALFQGLRPYGENHFILLKSDIDLAEWVQRNIPDEGVILAAVVTDHPLMLAGRRLFVAMPEDLPYSPKAINERLGEVNRISIGNPDAVELLAASPVTHVMVGPRELREHFVRSFFDHNLTYLTASHNSVFYEKRPIQ